MTLLQHSALWLSVFSFSDDEFVKSPAAEQCSVHLHFPVATGATVETVRTRDGPICH